MKKDIETDLISVIVPIFNVEAYLRPCIESILASTYTTLQIILVNDGSTDHSGEICDEYTRKDTRIEVIHQKNAGLSPARNSGMKAAKGKYISFIDGDDYIHPQMYEVLLEALQEGNYSFSMILGKQVYDNDKSYSIPSAYTKSILTQEIMIKSLFNHIHPQQGIKEVQAQVVWNKLYKRELLDNEQQAEVVRNIFEWYLQGMSLGQIKRRLEENQIKTASGKSVWSKSVIQEMLCNEKYMGDCMLQKYFTEDFLTGKKARNTGQRDRYYVHDSHQGIVSKEKFLEVACEMNRRKSMTVDADGNMVKKNRKYNPQNILGNILECEECGATFRRRTERGKVVYRCATRIEKGREACKESPTIEEEWIKTEIGKKVCGEEYDEEVVKKKVDRALIGKDGEIKILFV